MRANGRPFGTSDDAWIMAASLAEQAAITSNDRDATLLLDAAVREAVRAVGDDGLTGMARWQWNGPWTGVDALTLCAFLMQEAGATTLSGLLLDAVMPRLKTNPDLTYGRMLAQRARTAFFAAEHEAARDLYRQVEHLSKTLDSMELKARAMLGYAALAQVHGNFPELLEHGARALELATIADAPGLRWNAHYSIMLAKAKLGAFEESLAHGWRLLEESRGVAWHAMSLVALGQLLLEAGDLDSARAAFSAVMSTPLSVRTALAALGGLALTAVDPGRRSLLDWTVREVIRFRDVAVPFSYSTGLLDCVTALFAAGRHAEAEPLRAELIAIAEHHRFNEIAIRAESIRRESPPTASIEYRARSAQSARIIQSVRHMEPELLPEHVMLAGAGA